MITIQANNGQRVELHQEEPDGHLRVDTIDHKGNTVHCTYIPAKEVIEMLNEYIHDNNL